MPPPSLCGNFLTNKRSLVAFTWSLTTVLTLLAVCLAIVFTAHVHGHYRRMERYYTDLLEYNQAQREYMKEQGYDSDEAGHSSDDKEMEAQLQLGTLGSHSMAAVAAYTTFWALALILYGSTTIVGFTSMRGVYIAPCFSQEGSPTLKIGMFGGAIIFFANLLLVCAIVLGEVRVEDWTADRAYNNENDDGNYNNNNNNNRNGGGMNEPYEIERIAAILAVTCMFLAPLYIIFAVLLFFYFGDATDQGMLAANSASHYYEGMVDDTGGSGGPPTTEFTTMNTSSNNHHSSHHHPHPHGQYPHHHRHNTFGAPGTSLHPSGTVGPSTSITDIGRVTTPSSMVGSQSGVASASIIPSLTGAGPPSTPSSGIPPRIAGVDHLAAQTRATSLGSSGGGGVPPSFLQ